MRFYRHFVNVSDNGTSALAGYRILDDLPIGDSDVIGYDVINNMTVSSRRAVDDRLSGVLLLPTPLDARLTADGGCSGGGDDDDVIIDDVITTTAIVKGIAMAAVILAAVFGNLLVIVAVLRTEKLRIVANSFIVSLAVADLMVAVLVMTFSASQEVTGRWYFGRVVCDLFNANDVQFSTSSLLHLCCISVDRYIAITDPFRYSRRMTRRRVTAMLVAVWAASALLSHVPIHLGWYAVETGIGGGGDDRSAADVLAVTAAGAVVVVDGDEGSGRWIATGSEIVAATVVVGRDDSLLPVSSAVGFVNFSVYDSAALDGVLGSSGGGGDDGGNRNMCFFEVNKIYGLVSCAVSFWTPAAVMVGAYFKIYREAKRAEQEIYTLAYSVGRCVVSMTHVKYLAVQSTEPLPTSSTTSSSTAGTAAEAAAAAAAAAVAAPSGERVGSGLRRHQERRKMKSDHKAAKTLGVILGAFLACWLPFFTWYVTQSLCGGVERCPTPAWLVSTLFWIGYFNSALNPVIYAAFNRDFRNAFAKILGCAGGGGAGGRL